MVRDQFPIFVIAELFACYLNKRDMIHNTNTHWRTLICWTVVLRFRLRTGLIYLMRPLVHTGHSSGCGECALGCHFGVLPHIVLL